MGVSAVKLLLVDGGVVQKIVSREYPLSFPRLGWSEQNPEDRRDAVLDGVRELSAECDKLQVAGIGCGVHCADYSDASGTLLLDVAILLWRRPRANWYG